MLSSYLKIATAKDLYLWMTKSLTYEGKHKGWLREPVQVLEDKKAHCWESSELERCILKELGYSPVVVYLEDKKCTATHTTVVFLDGGRYCWFEWAWGKHNGLHYFKTLESAIDTIRNFFLAEYKTLAFYTKSDGRVVNKNSTELECVSRMRKWTACDGSRKLDGFSVLRSSAENIAFFKSIYPNLRSVRTGPGYFGDLVIDFDAMEVVAVLQCSNYQYIIALEVNPLYRGRGLATKLLKTAVSRYSSTRLTVSKNNSDAVRLYLHHGWKIDKESGSVLYMSHDSVHVKKASPIYARW